ncbi:zinc finger and BTB domain containing 10 [Cricetulus griseus]
MFFKPSNQKAQGSEIPSEEGYCDFNNRPNENSYCYQLLRQLDEQRKKDILCDVSIVVSGKIFKAHKNILVAGSRFFKTLYCVSNKESPNQNNTTHLDIAAVQGFSDILDFLYSGNLVLSSQNVLEVMTVASYLQMSEVVQTCQSFIDEALYIGMKSEAPESVIVDYNNRKRVIRDGLTSRDQKIARFWATQNLTNLASNIKIENDGCNVNEGQIESYQMNDSDWVQHPSSELLENESQGKTKVFIWNNVSSQETGKTRRKNQTTKRFVYNIPPNNETSLEDCSVMQPPVAYPEENTALLIKEEPVQLLQSSDGRLHCDGRSSVVHKKDKKYKCMVCKKIFMLAASVGIRHGSRRYGVCMDCADKSQPAGQEGVDQGQDAEFPRDEECEENEGGEPEDELAENGEDQNGAPRWDESGDVCMSLDD